MHYIARKIDFLKDVSLSVTFQDGKIIGYDLSILFDDYPQFKKLKEDRILFTSGKLSPFGYGIIWNEELDIDTSEIYENGTLIKEIETSVNERLAVLLQKTMGKRGINQSELAKLSGINQADISRIIDGQGNPTLAKIEKLFKAMDKTIDFKIDKRKIK